MVNRTFLPNFFGLSSSFDCLCGQQTLQLSIRLQVNLHWTYPRAIRQRLLRLKCVHSPQPFFSLSFHAFAISVSHRENIAPATGYFRGPQHNRSTANGRQPGSARQNFLATWQQPCFAQLCTCILL